MAITNHERVGKALDLLNSGLMPFFERELTALLAMTGNSNSGLALTTGCSEPAGKKK